jgi:hypothetical protein
MELTGIKHFVAFIAARYIKVWFTAPPAIAAPAEDLDFLKGLVSYPDSDIAKTASKKFANHLWYLSEYLAGLDDFDVSAGLEVKRVIPGALNKEGQEDPSLHAHVDLAAKEVIAPMSIAHFVASTSRRIFAEFNVNIEFLENDPVEREGDPSSSHHSKSCVGSQSSTSSQNVE